MFIIFFLLTTLVKYSLFLESLPNPTISLIFISEITEINPNTCVKVLKFL